jgi:hypothetical protein
MNQPSTTVGWWRSRAVRRSGTVAAVLVWIVLVGLAALTDGARSSVAWLLLLVVLVALWMAARMSTGDLTDGRPERLDEREMAIRWRLSRIGYVGALTAGLLGAVFLMVADGDPDLLRRGAALVLSLVVGAACLPSFLLAWTAENDDVDD